MPKNIIIVHTGNNAQATSIFTSLLLK